MDRATLTAPSRPATWLDRALAPFADVRAGEGLTALLMLANIFLLLVCYSIIKTVREPLILLGGGAEVRSYTAAGQALLLMGFVPLYSLVASRVRRMTLVLSATLFFVVCIELFAAAVTVGVPFVGVAFFIWVGIFNISLVAQFWSFANDLYSKESGSRLFPLIVIGMTAGAPLGSFVAGRLFKSGLPPQVILQLSALLLLCTAALYVVINRRATDPATRTEERCQEALPGPSGFALVWQNPYLRLVAGLIVLLNVVNTTGEYVVARLLSEQVSALAALNPALDKRAYIGAFTGEYQFWVGITALVMQAFVTSRLVKHRGLTGVLLALPLIALGGYAIIAAGAGFAVVRWVKTMENAADYSIMNTARQMLWLPTTREEKYKAKQAIDTFFVRGGDLASAAAVFAGTHLVHLTVAQFAVVNLALVVLWLWMALAVLRPEAARPVARRPWAAAAVALLALMVMPRPAAAQTLATGTPADEPTRASEWAALQADKATKLRAYEPDGLERGLQRVESALFSTKTVYSYVGSAYQGGGLAVGPGYRRTYGDSGTLDAHAALSIKNYKTVDAALGLPELAGGRLRVTVRGNWLDAPEVAFYGTGRSSRDDKRPFAYSTTSVGTTARFSAARALAFGGAFDVVSADASLPEGDSTPGVAPTYAKAGVFVESDTRTSAGYTTRGGYYRLDLSDYRDVDGGPSSFRRVDAEAQRFIPVLRENWIIAVRGLVSSTMTSSDDEVPFFLLPDLGGRTLRGYSPWRFRDRNRVLLSGEYRWTAGPFVDMALFVDAGTVAPRFSDLDLGRLSTSHGIGVSFHSFSTTVTRIELARSSEGTGLLFSFSPSF
jgi:AAA family ATP:ADP antiporter